LTMTTPPPSTRREPLSGELSLSGSLLNFPSILAIRSILCLHSEARPKNNFQRAIWMATAEHAASRHRARRLKKQGFLGFRAEQPTLTTLPLTAWTITMTEERLSVFSLRWRRSAKYK